MSLGPALLARMTSASELGLNPVASATICSVIMKKSFRAKKRKPAARPAPAKDSSLFQEGLKRLVRAIYQEEKDLISTSGVHRANADTLTKSTTLTPHLSASLAPASLSKATFVASAVTECLKTMKQCMS